MTEQPVLFGPDRALVGIESPGRVDVPTVVILNAGLLHRVGPNRMSVRLASSLADRGIGSFRFDLSGIGDSETTDTDLLDTERAIADIRSALDHLDARGGAGTYVAAGLCTGAFNAFRMVEQDERVVGAVMIDGYAYPTRRSKMELARARWLDPHVWFDRLVRRLRNEPTSAAPDDLVVYENVYVSQEEFGERLASVLDRNIPLLLMYTRFGPLDYTYRQQVCDNYPDLRLDERTTIRYYRTADHTFTLEENRAQAVADIVDWIESNYGTRR